MSRHASNPGKPFGSRRNGYYTIETFGSMTGGTPRWMRTTFGSDLDELKDKARRYRSTGAINRVVEVGTGKVFLPANSDSPASNPPRRRDPERITKQNIVRVKKMTDFVDEESAQTGSVLRTETEDLGEHTLASAVELVVDNGPWGSDGGIGPVGKLRASTVLYPADSYQDPHSGEHESTALALTGHKDAIGFLIDVAYMGWQDQRKLRAWVDVWDERDRLHINLYYGLPKDASSSIEIAEWWDDDARQMFEDGFFDGSNLEESVIEYAVSVNLWEE